MGFLIIHQREINRELRAGIEVSAAWYATGCLRSGIQGSGDSLCNERMAFHSISVDWAAGCSLYNLMRFKR